MRLEICEILISFLTATDRNSMLIWRFYVEKLFFYICFTCVCCLRDLLRCDVDFEYYSQKLNILILLPFFLRLWPSPRWLSQKHLDRTSQWNGKLLSASYRHEDLEDLTIDKRWSLSQQAPKIAILRAPFHRLLVFAFLDHQQEIHSHFSPCCCCFIHQSKRRHWHRRQLERGSDRSRLLSLTN